MNNKLSKKYKYILSIVDHFSKFNDSYLLENKTQSTILEKIKLFCEFYEYPIELGSDNGREFINPSVQNFCRENNIKLINGSPYSPHSQGAVERIYYTIRNMLLCIFLEDQEHFNLEKSLIKVMNSYNKTVHKVTIYTPNEVFYNNNKEFYKIIYNNTNEFYNKNSIKFNLFNIHEKCLLVITFIKSNQKYKKDVIFLLKNKVKKKNPL